jgi:hypothetical protein
MVVKPEPDIDESLPVLPACPPPLEIAAPPSPTITSITVPLFTV